MAPLVQSLPQVPSYLPSSLSLALPSAYHTCVLIFRCFHARVARSLNVLDLQCNPLGGSLPSALPVGIPEVVGANASVPNLRSLILSDCNLTGSLPHEWATLPKLTSLEVLNLQRWVLLRVLGV